MDLPAQPQAVNLFGVKTASIEGARRVLRTACRYYMVKADEAGDPRYKDKFKACAEVCDKAIPLGTPQSGASWPPIQKSAYKTHYLYKKPKISIL